MTQSQTLRDSTLPLPLPRLPFKTAEVADESAISLIVLHVYVSVVLLQGLRPHCVSLNDVREFSS